MLSTIGMKTSRAQCRTYIVTPTAIIVSATLRTLMLLSGVVSGGGGWVWWTIWRIRSAIASAADGQAGARLQGLVDGNAGLGPLGRRDDHELHVARRIAHDIDARDARLAEEVGLDGALARELAAQTLREVRLLCLLSREENRVARDGVAAPEAQLIDVPARVIHRCDAFFADSDLLSGELRPLLRCQTRSSVRAQHDAVGPGPE